MIRLYMGQNTLHSIPFLYTNSIEPKLAKKILKAIKFSIAVSIIQANNTFLLYCKKIKYKRVNFTYYLPYILIYKTSEVS